MVRLRAPLAVAVVSTALFFFAQEPGSQVRTEQGFGLETTTFQTPHGKVVVYLPEDMAGGDTITGTVVGEPIGTQLDEIAANQDELSGVVVEIADTKASPKEQTAKLSIPEQSPPEIPVVLRDKQGNELGRTTVPVKPKSAVLDCLKQAAEGAANASEQPQAAQPGAGCPLALPSFGQAGRPVGIQGSFTGDLAQTQIKIGGKPARVLAESPRRVIGMVPPGLAGVTDIELIEGGQSLAKSQFRSIGIKLHADKLKLQKGETTELAVTVSGLDGLADPVNIQLENHSPSVVDMDGGNKQVVTIDPGMVGGGQAKIGRTLTGIQPGGFTITTYIDPKVHRVERPTPQAQTAQRQQPPQRRQPQSCHIDGPVIDFEQLNSGELVGSQYNYLGVRFHEAPEHVTDHAGISASQGLPQIAIPFHTSSTYRALKAPTCRCEEQYGAGPIEIDFNLPQDSVSMMVGFLVSRGAAPGAAAGPSRRFVLRGFDAAGNTLDVYSDPLTQDSSITHCLRLDMPHMVKAVLDQEIDPQDQDWDFAIDDLSFNHPSPPLTATSHSLTIIDPPWDTVFYSTPQTVTALIYAPDYRPDWHIEETITGVDTRRTFRDNGSLTGGYPYYRYRVPAALVTGANDVRLALVAPTRGELASDHDELILRNPPINLSLKATAIEITQALSIPQLAPTSSRGASLAHAGVPLVQGKKTVVRVYAAVYTSAAEPIRIPAELHGYAYDGSELPGSPLTASLGPHGAFDSRIIGNNDSLIDQRLDPAKSWNFQLPASWTTGGLARVRAVINPDAAHWEGYTGANMTDEISLTGLRFFATSSLQINAFYLIATVPPPPAGGPSWNQPTYYQYSGTRDPAFTDGWINSVMPIADQSLRVIPDLGGGFDSCIGTALLAAGDCFAFDDLFNNLSATAMFFSVTNPTPGFDPTRTPYVLYNTEIIQEPLPLTHNTIGMAPVGSHAFANEVNAWFSAQDSAHEMTHSLGMDHAGHAHGEGGPEANWPTCHGGFALQCSGSPDTSTTSVGATDPARVLAFATAPRLGNLAVWNMSLDSAGSYIVKDPAAHAPTPLEPVDPTPCGPASAMHYHELVSYGTRGNGNSCDLGPWISPINYCRIFFTLSGAQTPAHDNTKDYCRSHMGLLSASELQSLRDVGGFTGSLLEPGNGVADAFLVAPADAPAPPEVEPGESMLVMAFDHPQHARLMLPVVVRAYHAPLDEKNESGGYFARLFDADHRQLLQVAMNSTPVSDHGERGKTFAVAQLPLTPAAAMLQVVHVGKDGEREIGKVQRPAGHLQVKITSPAPGSQIASGAPVVLKWAAPDDRSGYTRFSVSFSRDGRSFTPLVPNMRAHSVSIPSAALGGGSLSFRVTAENGFESATDQVDKLALSAQPAQLAIVSPRDNQHFAAGATVSFGAQVFDPQGATQDADLEWSSDRVGVFGTGRSLQFDSLPPGTHHVTVRIRGTAEASKPVTVSVDAPARGSAARPEKTSAKPK